MRLYGQARLPQLPDIDTEEQPDCLVVEPLVGSIPSMTFDPGTIESEVQQVLDELWNENLVPFALSVGKLTKERDGYTIHFHDSRIRTAHIALIEGLPVRDMVRAAVLDRVAKMDGPLNRSGKEVT